MFAGGYDAGVTGHGFREKKENLMRSFFVILVVCSTICGCSTQYKIKDLSSSQCTVLGKDVSLKNFVLVNLQCGDNRIELHAQRSCFEQRWDMHAIYPHIEDAAERNVLWSDWTATESELEEIIRVAPGSLASRQCSSNIDGCML